MESPQGERFRMLKKEAEKIKTSASERVRLTHSISAVDPLLVQSVSPRVLVNDLRSVIKIKKQNRQAPVAIFNDGPNQYWVRFFNAEDELGLVASYVQTIYQSGCSIHAAIVQTIPDLGVYDWFQIRSKQPKKKILSWFEKTVQKNKNQKPAEAHEQRLFDSIDIISEGEKELILEFKGRDQKGLLMAAVSGLATEGFNIRWAKIQTWGKRVEDIFSCLKELDTEERLVRLRKNLVIKNL